MYHSILVSGHNEYRSIRNNLHYQGRTNPPQEGGGGGDIQVIFFFFFYSFEVRLTLDAQPLAMAEGGRCLARF